ncbi:MAG: hypothetical protein II698_04915 [Ruminococcus sp.]|nr:hypothetical protein [Ruminococcus sp.]MBQ4238631.1 hypothetical protein [Ruminococcus sp.]
MDKKEMQNIGETIVKGKGKGSRPNRSDQMKPQTDPGDNKKYIQHTMEVARLEHIDLKNAELVDQRILKYFSICESNDMKPSVAGLALALGVERTTLWKIRTKQTGGYPSDVINSIKRAVQIINAMMEDYMQNGKINPVSGIFLMKNNMDYSDKQEVVVTPNNPLGTAESPEKLEERYRESVVIDTDGNDLDE